MKLWEKEVNTEQRVMDFTIGNDKQFDRELAPYDVLCSAAHGIMLGESGIIEKSESIALVKQLLEYYPVTTEESFQLKDNEEDIHTHLENYLTEKLGETGKKIHTGRSRNDQVMCAMQLFMKYELVEIASKTEALFNTLHLKAKEYYNILLPGYTHTQVAMPSSIPLWLGAYAESLSGDLDFAAGALRNIDQNPLGSAAGYGTSLPIDRVLTQKLLHFKSLMVSSVSAQLQRGKFEMQMATGISSIASTLSRLAADMIFFMGQDLNFISFPDELTTGSSIMPHKKNPDVLELIRAHCNLIKQMPLSLNALTVNLISGYHRDFQLSKQVIFPGIVQIKKCLEMMSIMVNQMQVRDNILNEEKYKFIFSVEEVNRKVQEGATFRDAYRSTAKEISNHTYKSGGKSIYTHIGSIGNPSLELITKKMDRVMCEFEIISIKELLIEINAYIIR